MPGLMPGPSRCPRSAGRSALASLVALVLVPGCATTNTEVNVPVVGRTVTLVTAKEQVKGELIVVEKDRLYVRAEDGVREIPLGAVSEARVKRHGFGKSMAYTWSLIGGLATGGALAAACNSADGDGCGGYGLVHPGPVAGHRRAQRVLVRELEPDPALASVVRAAAAVRAPAARAAGGRDAGLAGAFSWDGATSQPWQCVVAGEAERVSSQLRRLKPGSASKPRSNVRMVATFRRSMTAA